MIASRISLLKLRVDLIDITGVLTKVCSWSSEKIGRYICVSNVHMCMEVFDSSEFKECVNNADLVIPDGKPLVWGQQLLGYKDAQQVRGQDVTMALCQLAADQGLKVGFYGGMPETLAVLKERLLEHYPKLNIVYDYSPPFRKLTEQEDLAVVDMINAADVQILFVGLGCPKQEHWMATHKHNLKCVMLGVGAAFDFIAGNKKHAPSWMQSIGLEWFFRLCCEPHRLWKRYLKQNPRFIWYFTQQLLLGRSFK